MVSCICSQVYLADIESFQQSDALIANALMKTAPLGTMGNAGEIAKPFHSSLPTKRAMSLAFSFSSTAESPNSSRNIQCC
jgi:hypothetical protein